MRVTCLVPAAGKDFGKDLFGKKSNLFMQREKEICGVTFWVIAFLAVWF